MSLIPVVVGAAGPLVPVSRENFEAKWRPLEAAYSASGASVVQWLDASTQLPVDIFPGHHVEESTGAFLNGVRSSFDDIRGHYLHARSVAQTGDYQAALPLLIGASGEMRDLMQRALRFQVAIQQASEEQPLLRRLFAVSTWRTLWRNAKDTMLNALNVLVSAIQNAAIYAVRVMKPVIKWGKWALLALGVGAAGYGLYRYSKLKEEASHPPLNPRDTDWGFEA